MARSRKQRWIGSSAQVDYPQWRILGPDPSFLVRAVVVVPSQMVLIGIGIGCCCWWDGLDWKRRVRGSNRTSDFDKFGLVTWGEEKQEKKRN